MNKIESLNYRYLARIIIEAATPIVVKSGEKNFLTDGVVLRDVNGMPYIPGTSIAGVVRHAWKDAGMDVKEIFGFQEEKNGEGSKVIFTEARILDSLGRVVDGLQPISDSLLLDYKQLPIRQHVRITEKGVAADKGKFDEEIVYAGTRFCFEMEMLGEESDSGKFDELLEVLQNRTFRLGSGTRKGFGDIKLVSVWKKNLNLQVADDMDLYLSKSSNLEESCHWFRDEDKMKCTANSNGWTKYELLLTPENFFLFGSGYGDDEADMTPVKEKKVNWENGIGQLSEYSYLMPATSLKGAIAHRVAFHYNRLQKKYADLLSENERESCVGKNNEAVRILFGSEGNEKGEGKLRGNVILSDLYLSDNVQDKLMNHVAIDRFTGGAIDGALFTEKVAYRKTAMPVIELWVNKLSDEVQVPFELTLDDICKGMLPLGGGVNRGNGLFTGEIYKNGEKLCVER